MKLTQQMEDSIVNRVCERLAEKGELSAVLDIGDPEGRKVIEESLDRHAARQRAAGKSGW